MRLNIATLTAGAILIVLAMRSTASQSDSQATASMVSTIATSSPATATLADAKKISIRDAAILGIVEGVTEYLPVSSTGHLILVSNWLGYDGSSGATEKDAVDSFEIVIQLGAILAVVALYRRRVGQMIGGLAGRNRNGLRLIGLLLIAFTPAAVIGLLFHKTIKQYLFGPNPVCIALLIGGILMILIERWHRRRSTGKRENGIDDMSYRQALFIGLMQCLAMWPGTSRSMVTILAALLVGMNMLAAAEFSFLLALPTLGAATIYDGAKNWHALIECAGPVSLAVGMIVSCLVAAMAVKLFVKWLTSHGLTPFGVYRIILAGIVFWHLSGWKI